MGGLADGVPRAACDEVVSPLVDVPGTSAAFAGKIRQQAWLWTIAAM